MSEPNRVVIKNFEEDETDTLTRFVENSNYLIPRWNREGFRLIIIGGSGTGKTNLLVNFIANYWTYNRGLLITSKPQNERKFKTLLETVNKKKERVRIDYPKDGESIDEISERNEQWLSEAEGQVWKNYDDFTLKELLKSKTVIDDFRKSRKDNRSVSISTQSYDSSLGNDKKLIVNNITDFILFGIPSKAQISSITNDICQDIDARDFKLLVALFTRDPFQFLHYDMRAKQTGNPKINNVDYETEMTGIPFNSAVIRWSGDNCNWTEEECRKLKEKVKNRK